MLTFLIPLTLIALAIGKAGAEVECHAGAIDLVFVMDQSGSVGHEDYQTALNASAGMTDSLTIGYGMDSSHVGFVLFDDNATLAFGLNKYHNNKEVKDAIMALSYSGQGTNIAAGMDVAIRSAFKSGSRKNITKVMVIVTDGEDTSDVGAEHSLAQEMGIIIYALGVGSEVDIPELVRATGSSDRVFNVTDYNALADVMDQICHEIATVAPTIKPTPTVPMTSHTPRKCPCKDETDFMNVWLDIVFILDSSNGAGNDFESIRELLGLIATYYPIGQNGKTSRVAIVNVAETANVFAELTRYKNGTEMKTHVDSLKHLGGDIFYPALGLIQAQRMFDEENDKGQRLNVKKVVVLFTTKDIDCVYDGSRSKEKLQVKEGDNDPCRLAAHMVIDGVTLLTVAMALPDENIPTVNVATPCFNTSNGENMLYGIMDMLCMANCYCLPPYVQYTSPDSQCAKFGECIYVDGISLSYPSAQDNCAKMQATVTDILSRDKENFLTELHLDTGFFPYWVGVKRDSSTGKYVWDSSKEDASNDYSRWGADQPDLKKGDCVVQKQYKFNVTWASDKCGKMLPTHYFSCQKQTCDSQNYCDY